MVRQALHEGIFESPALISNNVYYFCLVVLDKTSNIF